MQQTIRHNSTVDAATPREVAEIIAAAFQRREDLSYHQEKGSISLNASGAGTFALRTGRLYGWLMQRVAITANPAAAALILMYENDPAPSDLREVIQLGTAGLYSDSFDNVLYIPPGSAVTFVVSSGAANGQLSYNLQIQLIRAAKG